MSADYQEYDVEVFHDGEPQYVVTITERDPILAEARAESAIFMMALRDGREWPRDSITARVLQPMEVTA